MCVVLGFDGQLVKLTADGVRITQVNVQIDQEMRQIALKIGYTGWLCAKLKKFSEAKQRDFCIGLCSQRLSHVVNEELQQFRKNIAILDAKVCKTRVPGACLRFYPFLTIVVLFDYKID